MEKTVAEKAKDKALEKRSETAQVVPTTAMGSGGTVGTISGIEAEDIRLPYAILVRGNTAHAVLADGSQAPVGSLFHATKKEAYTNLEGLIGCAVKGKSKEEKDGEEYEVDCYRAIVLPVDNPRQPFKLTFKGWNLWESWRAYISELSANGVSNLDHIVRFETQMVDTNNGKVLALKLVRGRETTNEEKDLINRCAMELGAALQSDNTEEDDVEDERQPLPADEDVDIDELLKELQ